MSILTTRMKYCILLSGDYMKRILSVLFLALALTGLCSCGNKNSTVILDNSDRSYFVDFYTEGDSVYIECVLNVYSDAESEATIGAIDHDNVKSGLLKSPALTGINKNDMDETFSLSAGENEITVLFKGEYAGVFSIAERDIPRFIEIKTK